MLRETETERRKVGSSKPKERVPVSWGPRFPQPANHRRDFRRMSLHEGPLLDDLEEGDVLEGKGGFLPRRFPGPPPDRVEEFSGIPDLLELQGQSYPLIPVAGGDIEVGCARVLPEVPIRKPLRHPPGKGVLPGHMGNGV